MEIKSLLIANRSEIVIRICETAKKMGIKTYGIKTSKEPNAYYLSFLDEIIDFSEDAEEIPEFLDVDRLINSTLLSLIGKFSCKSAIFMYGLKKTEQRLSVLNSKGLYKSDVDNLTIEKSDSLDSF